VLSTAVYIIFGQYMFVLMRSTVLKLCSKLSKLKYLVVLVRARAISREAGGRTVFARSGASKMDIEGM
jgi:hypothetical protein